MPVTTQWAVLTLAGASARTLLQQFPSDIDFSAAAFPHMNYREGQIAGRRVRVQRVSFTGELSCEISVPANEAEAFWDELMQQGAKLGITPIGLEAWLVLRLEKGFLHVGSDTDGTTNPLDPGLRRHGPEKGRRLRRSSLAPARQRSSNIAASVRRARAGGGWRVTGGRGAHHHRSRAHEAQPGIRHVGCFQSHAGAFDRLGVARARPCARIDEIVTIFDEGRTLQARVVKPAFFDPAGERMNG